MSKNKKNNKHRQDKTQNSQEQIKQQVETIRAALLALNDEQLQRVVAHVCTFTHDGEQLRKLLGYQVRALPTGMLYSTEAELTAAEADVPFSFVVPPIDAVRTRFTTQTAQQLLPIFKAMSNKVPAIKNATWHQLLQVELPALANASVAPMLPPTINPAFDATLLDTTLRQTFQARKDAVIAALEENVIAAFRTKTRFEVDQRGHLHDTGAPFIVEDYETVGDFLEEWDGKAGQLEQLSWQMNSMVLDMVIGFLPPSLEWLERENPSHYAELVAYVAYYGTGLPSHEDREEVAHQVFFTDIIGDTFIECESEAYDWIADRPLTDLVRGSDLPVTQSRARMVELPQMQALLHEFEDYCYSTAILTLTTQADPQPLTLDIHREGDTVTYGYAPDHKDLLMAKLLGGAGGLILRSFLAEQDPNRNIPIKELRGWALNNEAGQFVAQRIPADDLYWAMNTDSQTGKRLEAEPDVRYC